MKLYERVNSHNILKEKLVLIFIFIEMKYNGATNSFLFDRMLDVYLS